MVGAPKFIYLEPHLEFLPHRRGWPRAKQRCSRCSSRHHFLSNTAYRETSPPRVISPSWPTEREQACWSAEQCGRDGDPGRGPILWNCAHGKYKYKSRFWKTSSSIPKSWARRFTKESAMVVDSVMTSPSCPVIRIVPLPRIIAASIKNCTSYWRPGKPGRDTRASRLLQTVIS